MTPIIPVLLGAILGVDVGWTPAPDGSGEQVYIIQIEPELLDRLSDGEVVTSIIDSRAGAITQFRIQVGNGKLPRLAAASPGTEDAEQPEVIHSILPPVPDEQVLTISAAPAPQEPDVTPHAPSLDVRRAGEEPVGGDRGSDFLFNFRATTETNTFPGDEPGTSAELTNEEVHAAISTANDVPPPGEFVPNPAVISPQPVLPEPGGGDTSVNAPAAAVDAKPFVEVAPATYEEIVDALTDRPDAEPPRGQAARPWLPFTLTFMALLASLGGNAYLGYIFIALYRRHRQASNAANASTPAVEQASHSEPV